MVCSLYLLFCTQFFPSTRGLLHHSSLHVATFPIVENRLRTQNPTFLRRPLNHLYILTARICKRTFLQMVVITLRWLSVRLYFQILYCSWCLLSLLWLIWLSIPSIHIHNSNRPIRSIPSAGPSLAQSLHRRSGRFPTKLKLSLRRLKFVLSEHRLCTRS